MHLLSSFLLVVLLGAPACYAAPLLESRGIGADLMGRFKLMEQYASAAYCANNINSPGDQIKCGTGNCPLVQAADSKTVIEYERKDTSTDVTGFVAVDKTNKLIVVSFRGSTSIDSWRTDIDYTTVPVEICPKCTAHRGFWTSWTDARGRVLPAVKQATAANPGFQLIVTGHSLGGAIASFAAAQLRNTGYSVALYTFGSPRIGGTAVCSYITNQPGGNYRITHWNDPIPNVPLQIMGFVHISPEYYINKATNLEVQASDIQTYDGSSTKVGNAAWLLKDLDAHRWYFKSMYLCVSPKYKRGELDIRGSGEKMVGVVARF